MPPRASPEYSQPPTYTSEAWLMVAKHRAALINAPLQDSEEKDGFSQNQSEIIRSPRLLEPLAIRRRRFLSNRTDAGGTVSRAGAKGRGIWRCRSASRSRLTKFSLTRVSGIAT